MSDAFLVGFHSGATFNATASANITIRGCNNEVANSSSTGASASTNGTCHAPLTRSGYSFLSKVSIVGSTDAVSSGASSDKVIGNFDTVDQLVRGDTIVGSYDVECVVLRQPGTRAP